MIDILTISKVIVRSLIHYRKSHLVVALGAAVCAMVFTGTLFVGDSVDTSLKKTTELRLGKTAYVFSGIDRYFRSELAAEIRDALNIEVAPIMLSNGIASSQGGTLQVNNVDILGVDEFFMTLSPASDLNLIPGTNEAFISQNLANRLQLNAGDDLLLKIEKASLIPKNAPFISDAGDRITLRLKVSQILGPDKLGRFNLRTSQTAPFNVFLNQDFLNESMGTQGKANRLLFGENPGLDKTALGQTIHEFWTPQDLGLKIIPVNQGEQWEVRSERVFIDSIVTAAVDRFEPGAAKILTYFANSIRKENRETPYSFISAGPFSMDAQKLNANEIIINSWLAEDLLAKPGDSMEISYYVIGPLRKLEEVTYWFHVKAVVPQSGIFADRELMPHLPGLTDAGNCRDWDTGIPIDLDKIRDKDEDYWNRFHGTPKAFISYPVGKSLWQNRFGTCTAIRFPYDSYTREDLEINLKDNLDPDDFGFTLQSVKEEGLAAASGGVDFSQLFMGLSFFLLLAALILLALLFNIHLEKRMSQIGTLKAIGIPGIIIRHMMIIEGLLVAIPGVIAGGLLAIMYNKLIFFALNTVWFEIVRTSVLQEDIQKSSFINGVLISLLLAWGTLLINVYSKTRRKTIMLQRGSRKQTSFKLHTWIKLTGWIIGILAIILLVYETLQGDTLNAPVFFIAGGLLLLSFIMLLAVYLRRKIVTLSGTLSPVSLAIQNLHRNNTRSLRIVILFALGTFVIVSTGLNRKDLHTGSENKESGTGGFQFYAETTVPILIDLNAPDGREKYGLETPLSFVQLRKSEGDDASCLNLNRISQPRILGIPSGKLEGRFSFVKDSPDLDPDNPWRSLTTKLPGGIIPAVADQTVIQWGLGMKVGDTLKYRDEFGHEMKLKLIGGLAGSIFQGNVLIDEDLFLTHFPSHSGTNVLLIDRNHHNKEQLIEELERSFRNDGLDLSDAAVRLASFNEIENTYLSIFLILGGLAMILGTIGLGLSLARNILDRQQELAVLRAVGYQRKSIQNILTGEHMILLSIGTLIGALTAFIATMPSILSAFVKASWHTAALIILLILLNGLIWIRIITGNNLKKELLASLRTE